MARTEIVDLVRRIKLRADAVGLRCVLHPPVSRQNLTALASRLGKLPDDVAALLTETSAIELGPARLAFGDPTGHTAQDRASPWALFPFGLILGADATGNALVLDLGAEGRGRGLVLAVLHRPADVVVVAQDLASVLQSIGLGLPKVRDDFTDAWSPLDTILAPMRRGGRPSRMLVAAVTRQMARESTDPVLRQWALSLPDRARIVDLRNCAEGRRFAWGFPERYIEFWRHHSELLFGFLPNPKPRSIWGFVTGFDEPGEHRRAARLLRQGVRP